MGFPAQLDKRDLHFPDDDTVSHFAARELQIILRVVVVLSIVATAVTMATLWYFAWIPLIVLLIAWIGLVIIGIIERRTRNERLARLAEEHRRRLAREIDPEAETPAEAQIFTRNEDHFTPMRLLIKESIIGLEIIIGLGLAAVALAVVGLITGRLPWDLVLIAVGLFVVYGLFVMAPIWLGWFTDVIEVERGDDSNERAGVSKVAEDHNAAE